MHDDAETRLLTEGALTYVNAVNAVRAFQDIIQRRCRQVIQSRLAEYSKALGLKLSPDALLDWATGSDWSGEEATIGTYFKFGRVSALYHHTYLAADEASSPEVAMTVYLGTRKKRDRFWEALSPHEPALIKLPGDREIWLGESVPAQEFGQFDEKFDQVLTRWIELWKRAGGLKRLLKLNDEEE